MRPCSSPVFPMQKRSSMRRICICNACRIFISTAGSTTARSANRAREVGLRKVVGSMRTGLIQQFLLESMVFSYFAFLLALGLAVVLLPLVNQLAATHIRIPLDQWWLLPVLLAAATVIGLLAGLYPSFYLSKFRQQYRSEEHTSELQSPDHLLCRLLLEKKN